MIVNPHPEYAKITTEGILPGLDIGEIVTIGDIEYKLLKKSKPSRRLMVRL